MSLIYVRTVPGRRAYFEGRVIPNDQFVPVTETPSIRRLRDHFHDIEQEAAPTAPPTTPPSAPQSAPQQKREPSKPPVE